ncbi:MAG: hypothetical protein K9N23_06795 [Akkermansiaceae bacterium]|nr:hypothetical protein [Akkermansiaceae bacterium]
MFPDSQSLTRLHPEGFICQAEWVALHKKSHDIRFTLNGHVLNDGAGRMDAAHKDDFESSAAGVIAKDLSDQKGSSPWTPRK